MKLRELSHALRREVARGSFDDTLSAHREGLEALVPLADGAAVLARFDALPDFCDGRDGLLRDLLRLHRRSGDGAVLGVLCYGLRGLLERACLRAAALDPPYRDERLAELLSATVVQLTRFDQEGRSVRVQAGLERDVQHHVWLAWRRRSREYGSLAELAQCFREAGAEVANDPRAPHELMGPAKARRRRGDFDDEDRAEMEAVLLGLLERRVVDAREFRLLREARVYGRRLEGVASELGMTLAGAQKVLQRAAPRIREALRGARTG